MKIIELFDKNSGRKVAEIPASELEAMDSVTLETFRQVQELQGRRAGVVEKHGRWEDGDLGGKWVECEN